MRFKDNVLQEIKMLLIKFDDMPIPAELKEGWTDESVAFAKDYVNKIYVSLTTGTELPDLGIVRGLNYWGVAGGDLLEDIARITNQLRKQESKQQ